MPTDDHKKRQPANKDSPQVARHRHESDRCVTSTTPWISARPPTDLVPATAQNKHIAASDEPPGEGKQAVLQLLFQEQLSAEHCSLFQRPTEHSASSIGGSIRMSRVPSVEFRGRPPARARCPASRVVHRRDATHRPTSLLRPQLAQVLRTTGRARSVLGAKAAMGGRRLACLCPRESGEQKLIESGPQGHPGAEVFQEIDFSCTQANTLTLGR